MPRPLDKNVDEAIREATLALLSERGFARMSIEAIASAARVGKPAIYRRYPDKAALVAAVIASQLPALVPPDLGDTRAELRELAVQGFPADGPAYVGLIGGLIAEQQRHPALIDAFRRTVLLPRRATVQSVIERGQARGEIGAEHDPEYLVDTLAGPFLARVFAGAETGPRWRERAFDRWWDTVKERKQA
jgi:AcrR family transcriptional regulator